MGLNLMLHQEWREGKFKQVVQLKLVSASRETNSRKLEMSINSQDMGVRQWKSAGQEMIGWKMGAEVL